MVHPATVLAQNEARKLVYWFTDLELSEGIAKVFQDEYVMMFRHRRTRSGSKNISEDSHVLRASVGLKIS